MNRKQSNQQAARKGAKPKPKRSEKKKAQLPLQKGNKDRNSQVPVAFGSSRTTPRPRTRNEPNGDIVIRHREYFADVNGSIAFASSSYGINPGRPGSFPWLSTIARSYESYRFESLQFEFRTVASSTSTGTVILTIDYDSYDASPTSKQQALAYRSAASSQPWLGCKIYPEREDLNKRTSYFVLPGPVTTGQDANLYNTGFLYVCTAGQADTSIVGELYADYQVRLMTPQIGSIGVGESIYANFVGSSNASPFATKSGNLPATVSSTGTTTSVSTFTFTQPWEGYVTVNLVGTVLTGVAPSGTATSAEIADVLPPAALSEMAVYSVSALAAQTFILTIGNTTITSSAAYFAQADV